MIFSVFCLFLSHNASVCAVGMPRDSVLMVGSFASFNIFCPRFAGPSYEVLIGATATLTRACMSVHKIAEITCR